MQKQLEDKENKLKKVKTNNEKNEDVKKKKVVDKKADSVKSKGKKNSSATKSKNSSVKSDNDSELKKVLNTKKDLRTNPKRTKSSTATIKKETSSKTVTKKATGKTSSKTVQVTQAIEKADSKEEKNIDKKLSNKKFESSVSKKSEKDNKKEATIIEKIKSFLAKIAEMQEEARKEKVEKRELIAKEKKEKEEKENKKEENKKMNYLLEYYDLHNRYNETVVKILAQTPKRLFVYWDIADSDREKYIKTFGEDFYEKTYPVLLVYNENKNYITEVTINDFANSWYIDINDPKTNYVIQLGRKFREKPSYEIQEKSNEENIILHTDYLPIANSNKLEVPNDHVLFEELKPFVLYRNVKNNQEFVKEIKDIKNEYGKVYDVKEFYNQMYKDEIDEGIFDMNNPSSGLNSSSFK